MRPTSKLTAALAIAGVLAGCAGTRGPGRVVVAPMEPEAEAYAAFLEGNLAQREGRLLDAAQSYERAAALEPDEPELHRYLAGVWVQIGQLERAVPHAERALELAPDDAELRLPLARLYMRLDRFEEASQTLEPLLAAGELSQEGTAVLFALYVRVGRVEDAERIAAQLMQESPTDLRPYYALAAVYERVERWDDAADVYRRALKIDPEHAPFYDQLANVRRIQGDLDAELAVWREKLRLVDADPVALGRIAEIHEQAGRTEEARTTLETLIAANPDLSVPQLRLGVLLYETGEYEAAALRFESVVRDAEALAQPALLHAAQYFLGLSWSELERYEDALALLEQVPPTSVRFADARRLCAWIHERLGDLDQAIIEARRALAASEDPRQLGVFLAGLLLRNGELDDALAMMNDLIAEHPDDVKLLYELGVIHGEADDMDRALEVMYQVLEREPENYSALNYVGYSWAERGERLEEAEQMVRRAIELKPDDGYIIDSLGWVLYQRGLRQIAEGDGQRARELFWAAIEQLELALAKLERADPVITWHLGDAYRSVSRFEEALLKYRAALALDPEDDDAAEIRVQIELLELQLREDQAGADR